MNTEVSRIIRQGGWGIGRIGEGVTSECHPLISEGDLRGGYFGWRWREKGLAVKGRDCRY